MICLIPVHALPADGIELRTALRSIDMYAPQIEDVLIVGERKPTWYLGPFEEFKQDPKLSGVSNVMRKLHAMTAGMKGDFCWTSDDQYWTKPWKTLPVRHMSSSPIRKSVHDSGYRRAQEALKRRGVEFKHDYELHCPVIFDAQKIHQLLAEEKYDTPLSYRTLYGNIYTPDSVPLLDVKTMNFHKPQEIRPYYSTGDSAATDPLFIRWIKEKFPTVSRWEIEYVGKK